MFSTNGMSVIEMYYQAFRKRLFRKEGLIHLILSINPLARREQYEL
jgi:hypothetical protein